MSRSIIQDRKECYICRCSRVECHHIFNGSNRTKSDNDGLTIWLCRQHHNMIHNNQALDERIKGIAQQKYMSINNLSIKEFCAVYGKNYIKGE